MDAFDRLIFVLLFLCLAVISILIAAPIASHDVKFIRSFYSKK